MVDWLVDLVDLLAKCQKSMEMGCKIHPKSTKLGAKIQQVGPRIRQNRFQEASWRDPGGLLGPACPEDRPKSQKVARRTPDGPPWTSHFGGPNRPKSMINRTWKPIGYRAPKKMPKVTQNPSKIDPKSIQNRSKIDHFFDHVLRLLLDFVLALD